MKGLVLAAALLVLPAAASAHHECADFTVTPQQLHARLTAPPGTALPHADFTPTTPQELHARLTDPAVHAPDMHQADDE
jgi:hypothetical protein